MSFKMFDIKAFLMWKKLVNIQLWKDFKVCRISSIFFWQKWINFWNPFLKTSHPYKAIFLSLDQLMLENYMKSYNALWNWIITFDSVMICNVIISCDHIQVEWVFYRFFQTVDNYRNGYRKIIKKYLVIFM